MGAWQRSYQSKRTFRIATTTNTSDSPMVERKRIFSTPRRTLKVLSACPKTLGFIPRAWSRSMTTSTIAKVNRMISNHTNCYPLRRIDSRAYATAQSTGIKVTTTHFDRVQWRGAGKTKWRGCRRGTGAATDYSLNDSVSIDITAFGSAVPRVAFIT